MPVGGDTFNAVSDERLARELVEQRLTEQKEEMFNSQTKVTLDNLFEQIPEPDPLELLLHPDPDHGCYHLPAEH